MSTPPSCTNPNRDELLALGAAFCLLWALPTHSHREQPLAMLPWLQEEALQREAGGADTAALPFSALCLPCKDTGGAEQRFAGTEPWFVLCLTNGSAISLH